MNTENTGIEKIIEEINSKNAKKVAFFLVLCFTCYHALLHVKYGSNSCRWLLSDGRYKGDNEWQPYGCMLHPYTKIDTKRCLRYMAYYGSETHFAFVGDSRIRQLYIGLVTHMSDNQIFNTQSEITNLSYYNENLNIKVEYLWAPFVSKEMTDYFKNWDTSQDPPSVIVVGSAVWPIISSNGSKDAVEQYKRNISRLIQPIDSLFEKKSRTFWTIQPAVNEEKLGSDKLIIENNLLDLYNNAAIEILSHSKANLWWSIRLIGQGMVLDSPDGIHLADRPLKHCTQILLNMYCNDNMNFNDGTCCSSMESYTTLQIVVFAVLGICVITASCIGLCRFIVKLRGRPFHEYQRLPENETELVQISNPNYYSLFITLTKLAIIMTYFFTCDRTNFFMKENKYYSEFSFWLPIGYVMVLGLFFTEDSKLTKVLHRDQLNESRGWMQLVILVYHVTGASRILVIKMHVKVLISAYLFLLGYEQFTYVWHRGDISIVNFFRNLFKLNFMTVTLCLCMNRPYQFYYFGPLLSFWYMMIYYFLAFPPHITAQTCENNPMKLFYLLVKFICLFTIITVMFLSEVFFEKIFVTRPWKALFVTTDDDIHEWWFRWKLDRYTSVYGMCFSVLLILGQKYNIFDDNNHSNLFSKRVALSTALASFLGIGTYTAVTFLCRYELDCSEIHSYIAFIPIVSYIVLRNMSGMLRTRYSTFFAWFGEIHLELFLSQYHIWLAADTHGVLVLIPGFPVVNLIVTTYIFVCASHEMHQITKVLLPVAVPADWKHVLRNLILFMAILVPIGINDGMF
ncbi:N-acetylneuraminate 9-O-acetyltransferase [Anthonomus grandis grandis]|uniref:N-acetylneuraminate 9-O-acetyltransferase n=1 Tax=Anthonomus grandis grandis TaxID=2921223 RepID=UPI0021650D1B|nr:N-acetylneuraminate 9-O-acetyltransferase [Anthonomus grandis grandis]